MILPSILGLAWTKEQSFKQLTGRHVLNFIFCSSYFVSCIKLISVFLCDDSIAVHTFMGKRENGTRID